MITPIATYTVKMFLSDQLFIRRCVERMCKARDLPFKFRYMADDCAYCTKIKFWLHPRDVALLEWLSFWTFVETETEITHRPFRTKMPAACRPDER